MAKCNDCTHFELCKAFERCNGLMRVDAELCSFFAPDIKIVRCKNCSELHRDDIRMSQECMFLGVFVDDDDFCSYGKEKKDGEL